MVSTLTFDGIFCHPFSTESFRLRCLADRTITLFAVFSVKWMTIFTMCPHSIYSRYRTRVDKTVLLRCYNPKMGNVNTVSILTNMVYKHTIRYITAIKVISHSMGASITMFIKKYAIAIFVQNTLPKMTLTIGNPLTIEPFNIFIHIPSIPYTPNVREGGNNG